MEVDDRGKYVKSVVHTDSGDLCVVHVHLQSFGPQNFFSEPSQASMNALVIQNQFEYNR